MNETSIVQERMFGLEPEPFGRPKAGASLTLKAGPIPPPAEIMPALEGTGEPGKWKCRIGRMPEYVVCETIRHPDGTLSLRPSGIGSLCKFSEPLLRALGFDGRLETLRRLARAGFIKLYALSPSVNLVDMDSLWAHLENVAEDRDFWDREGDNFRHYCHVNGLDEQAQARLALAGVAAGE